MTVTRLPDSPSRSVWPAPPASWPALSGLLLLWCLWLLVAWAWATWLNYGSALLWQRRVSLAPAARFVLAAATIGLMIVWPVVRLSQAPAAGHSPTADPAADPAEAADSPRWRPLAALAWTLRDWLALNAVLSAVIAALGIGAGWWLQQMAAISATLAGWSLLSGLLIAWGVASGRGWVRVLLTLAALVLLGHNGLLPVQQVWFQAAAPAVWALNHGGVSRPTLSALGVLAGGALGLSALVMLALAAGGRRSRS